MHAVVTKSTVHDVDRAREVLNETGIPRLKQAPGFVSANFVRLDDGTGRGMIIFESEEEARAAAEMLKTNPPAGDAVTVESIDVGMVAGHA